MRGIIDLSVDRVCDIEGIPPYVIGYRRELDEEVSAPKAFFVFFYDTHVVKKELVVARHLGYLRTSWNEKEERKFDKMDADNTRGVIGKVT